MKKILDEFEKYIEGMSEVSKEDAVNELVLYAENDGKLYESHVQKICKKLAKDKINGIYNQEKALQVFKIFANVSATKYKKEFPDTEYKFSKDVKDEAAKEFLNHYQETIDYYVDKMKTDTNESVSFLEDGEYSDKVMALAELLGIEPSEISQGYDENIYETENGEEYYVFDNSDDAWDRAIDYCKDVFDDVGFDGINWDYIGGIENYVNKSWFKEAHLESNHFYAEDVAESEPERFVEECQEYGINPSDYGYDPETGNYDDSSLIDDFAQAMYDAEGYDSDIAWYIDSFGRDDFNQVVKEHNLIDEDALAEAIVNYDGIGQQLASYDGEESTIKYDGTTYWIYRIN